MEIDLEPTWTEILNMVKSGHLKAKHSDLDKACAVADIVRQAQKGGANFVKFVFVDGEVEVEIDSESDEEPIQTEAYQDIDPNSTYGSFLSPLDADWDDANLIEETDYLEEDDE